MPKKSKRDTTCIASKNCSVCGKEFVPAPFHMYKASLKGRAKIQCSYTCWRKAGGGNVIYSSGERRLYRTDNNLEKMQEM